MEVDREDYSWDHAAKDLAIMTSLNIHEAGALTRKLHGVAHPYDVLPILLKMVNITIHSHPEEFGYNLRRLMELKKEET